MNKTEIGALVDKTYTGLTDAQVPEGVSFTRGKVRDVFDLGENLLIVTTDRISAFDRVLSSIPCKGEVLNRTAGFWFGATEHIIANHVVDEPTARSLVAKKCDVLPVEVVVRGYLTGSAWRDYEAGNAVSGIALPQGMKFNQKFDTPLLTPSTKAERGDHDEPISSENVVKQGLVEEGLWNQVVSASMDLFAFGTQKAAENGLILVDTKYEFGIAGGELYLIDEVHTPDSSRFWYIDTYDELFKAGEKQRKLDKEYLRQWLMEKGYMGEGEAPVIPDEVRLETAFKYVTAFETITGEEFHPESLDPEAEIKKVLSLIEKHS